MLRLSALLALATAFLACNTTDPVDPPGPGSGGHNQGGSAGQAGEGGSAGSGGCCNEDCQDPPLANNARKVDLLLMVDNSRNMADKQRVLAEGIEELVGVFINPRCLDPSGIPVANQPASSAEPCPARSEREFDAVADLHIGVISSSIGGHGSDACTGNVSPTENDQAHLLARDENGATLPTWEDKGFLAWDPTASLTPPGSCNGGLLADDLEKMIVGTGELGCGFEAQLESWYRFLVDPDPYASIAIVNYSAELMGTDQALLDQRAAFLRPDSVLVILMLTEENDCSTRDGGQYFFANQLYSQGSTPYHLPPPRAACAVNPNDPCCRSCGQAPGTGCDTSQDDCSASLSALEDAPNMRCFDQKRRFGIDFMWPVDRYVTGLTSTEVPDRFGNLVPNPIFAQGRSPSDVYLAGIVGVPWQDIARRDQNGDPDLTAGLQSATELVAEGTWDVILGDPANYVVPDDPLMIESIAPRSGQNPITGDALAPPGSALLANPINGHEFSTPENDDLQYACIFQLPQPRDCTTTMAACECNQPNNDNPLCQAPNGQFGTIQYYAKAYPAMRELRVLKGLGTQGIVGSVCPAQLNDPSNQTYGYRPTFKAIAEAVNASL